MSTVVFVDLDPTYDVLVDLVVNIPGTINCLAYVGRNSVRDGKCPRKQVVVLQSIKKTNKYKGEISQTI